MKQIYCFNYAQPPAISEKMLRIEIERRKTRLQTALAALAVALFQWCLLVAAVMLYSVNIYLSVVCMSYNVIAVCGAGVIVAVYANKRRNDSWLLLHLH